MTYLVNDKCIKCKHTTCVDVCPVDCFYEGKNMLVIKPDECIDCGVCEPECPIDAIISDTETGSEKWLEVNKKYSEIWPNISEAKEDIRGFNSEVFAFFNQIANLTEEGGIVLGIDGRPGLVAKPRIDTGLHVLAYRQQLAVARRQLVNRGVETCPEAVGRDAAALEQTGVDEIGKLAGNRQVSAGNVVGHAYLQ